MIHSTPQSPSHSRLSCLHHCSRKYWHRYECDYEEPEEVIAPLFAGKVMHAGLDSYYRNEPSIGSIGGLLDAWINQGNPTFYGDNAWLTSGHMQVRMQKYINNDAGDWKPLLLREDEIEWGNVIEHEANWDSNGNLIMSESRFLVSIGEELSIVSVPDLVLMHDFGEGSVPVVVDHKCRFGWINEQQRTEMEIGHQLRMQALVVEALTGLRCRDGWMNSIYIGVNSTNPKSKAKMRELSMFGPWSHEQMRGTWDWIKAGSKQMQQFDITKQLDNCFDVSLFSMNPGLHCHYCEFREECVGE